MLQLGFKNNHVNLQILCRPLILFSINHHQPAQWSLTECTVCFFCCRVFRVGFPVMNVSANSPVWLTSKGAGHAPVCRGRRGTTHHGDAVVEQRFSKHHDEEDLVDVDLLKHGNDSDRVDGGDETAEEKVLQQTDVQVPCCRRRQFKGSVATKPDQQDLEEITFYPQIPPS